MSLFYCIAIPAGIGLTTIYRSMVNDCKTNGQRTAEARENVGKKSDRSTVRTTEMRAGELSFGSDRVASAYALALRIMRGR
jgi:hypothetical protein